MRVEHVATCVRVRRAAVKIAPMRSFGLLPVLLTGACVTPPSGAERSTFPDAWLGTWRGEVVWRQRVPTGEPVTRTVELTLTIGPRSAADEWSWELRYAGQPPRRYRLRAVDPVAGRYEIDEGDGLVLAASWFDDTLASRFAVGDALLFVRQRFEPDAIEHEIWSGPVRGERVTGDVDTRELVTLQRAVLRREP